MTWILAYAIGALAFLALLMLAAKLCGMDQAGCRKVALEGLRAAPWWPLELVRFACCLVAAALEIGRK